MLIDWYPGGPQIRTGCVLDAGTCIQYASSTKWAIPKSPKKDKKFFFLNFSVTPLWQNVTPLWQNVTPPLFLSLLCHALVTKRHALVTKRHAPSLFFIFFGRKIVTKHHALSRPPRVLKKFWATFASQDCDKTSRPCDKTSRPPYFCHFYVTPLWQNVTPLWQNVTPPRLLGDSKGIWKKPLAPVSYWMRTGCRFLHPVRIQYGFTHPIFLFFLNFS